MLLKRLPGILPEMTIDQCVETLKIKSISRKSGPGSAFLLQRPFRSPHHSISYVGMVGGGASPMPGEISLAHHGVLFLDELPEFPRQVLEVLRQPIEDGKIEISRANFSVDFPAKFLLTAAMNPCPCGYFGDEAHPCRCQSLQIRKYWKKVSGPILDRVDIILEIPRLKKEDFVDVTEEKNNVFTTEKMKRVVEHVRDVQSKRFGGLKTNGEMTSEQMKTFCPLASEIRKMLAQAVEKGLLTGRTHDKIIKVARTIADLDGSAHIEMGHVCEALQYRSSRLLN
jgi:magnesium chelatase family protein